MIAIPEYLMPIILPALAVIILVIMGLSKKLANSSKALGLTLVVFFTLTLTSAIRTYLHYTRYGEILTYWLTEKSTSAACLEIDLFSVVMITLFTMVGLIVAIYSIDYMEGRPALLSYYVLLSLMVLALNGLAMAGDLFTFFVFYELIGVTAYSLVSYFKNYEAIEAAIKYIIMDATGSTLVLMGFAMIYGLTGTLNIAASTLILSQMNSTSKMLIMALLFSGFSFKAAIFPMHSWLIDAHPAAPSGISAMLSGVVIKSGLYAIIRTFIFFEPVRTHVYDYIVLIAILTMTIPNIIALVQTDIKRILAYSSIYNMGIVIAGISIATPLGVTAGIFHAINHALLKALMFMAAGVFVHATGKRQLEDLKGIGRSMPITSVFFGLGALALMGLPPLNAFYSKLLIAWAAIQLGGVTGTAIAALILINSIISIGYYGKLIKYIIMEAPTSDKKYHEEPVMVIALAMLVAVVIMISVNPNLVLTPVQNAVRDLFNPTDYINNVVS